MARQEWVAANKPAPAPKVEETKPEIKVEEAKVEEPAPKPKRKPRKKVADG